MCKEYSTEPEITQVLRPQYGLKAIMPRSEILKDKIHEIMGGIQTLHVYLHGALKDAIVPDVEEALSKVK